MMGVSHAYCGLALGCAATSLVIPHDYTMWEVAGALVDNSGAWGLILVPLALLVGGLAPGLLVPDAAIPNAPPLVLVVFVLITGGAALLPDLDHVNSTVARTLGPITGVISRGLNWFAWSVYHATRLPGDPGQREDGHRLITHTYAGSAGFAVIATGAALVHPVGAGIVAGLCSGLLAVGIRHTIRRIEKQLPRSMRWVGNTPGITVGSASGCASWYMATLYPTWSLAIGIPVFLGCVIHREGDWCTNSGVPRRLWPLPEDDGQRRWKKHKAPITFDTGHEVEKHSVRPVLAGAVVLALLALTGLPATLPGLGAALAGVSA